MVVFYLCIFIISLIFMIMFSSIIFEIEKLEISDMEKLKRIMISIENRDYYKIFDYIIVNISIKISICSIFKITIIKLNEDRVKNIVSRIIKKLDNEMKRNPKKFIVKKEKQKKKILNMKNNLNISEKIKLLNICAKISFANAETTALVVTILNSVVSILYFKLFEENRKNKNYAIEPIYSEKLEFYLNTKLKFKILIFSQILNVFIS